MTVHFPPRVGLEFPVIEIPSGIRTPVASKTDLLDANGVCLIRKDAVFVRSLTSNGIASSTNQPKALLWRRRCERV